MKSQISYNKIIFLLVAIGITITGFTLFDTVVRSKENAGLIIARDVLELRDIFQKIHKDCGILDFDQQKNSINFLNVEKFTGSEVGPMNLIHPEKWQGPYAQENPTIYHIAYQVVSTNNGYFVTPGNGVKLPNKKVIGKDILLDKNADIEQMMKNPEELLYQDKPLAARLSLGEEKKVQFFLDEE